MLRLVVVTLFTIMVASGCTTMQLKSDYNPKTDFSSLKTFGWLLSGEAPSKDVRVNNELVVSTIRAAVEEELTRKGFTKVESGNPDFVVTWFGAIEQKIKKESLDHFYARYGYGAIYRDPNWNAQPASVEVGEYEQGTIIFDFIDTKNKGLIWRGVGSDRLQENATDTQVKSNLRAAVKKILEPFPPQ